MSLSNSLKSFFNRMRANCGTDTVAQAAPVASAGSSLDGLRVVDLKALAKERGLTGYSKLSKSQLLELLK
jgi:hypothetical protein